MQVGIVVIPVTAKIFSLTQLNVNQWAFALLISVMPVVIMEFQKKLNEVVFGKTVYKYKEVRN